MVSAIKGVWVAAYALMEMMVGVRMMGRVVVGLQITFPLLHDKKLFLFFSNSNNLQPAYDGYFFR